MTVLNGRKSLSPLPQDAQTAPADRADETAEFEKILYHLTHDLRSVLRSMITLPGWIKEEIEEAGQTLPGDTAQYLNIIERGARRADDLLLSLRDYSRVGRKSASPELLDLEVLLGKAVQMAGVPETVNLDIRIGKCSIEAPQREVEHLLAHIIRNAWQHNDPGQLDIRIESDLKDNNLCLSVSDNGVGIDEKYRDRVFDLMYTLKGTEDGAGHGIGLAYCRRVTDFLRGEIAVSGGSGGQGTTVTVRLPLIVPRIQAA